MTQRRSAWAFIRSKWERGRGAEDIAADLGDGWTWGHVATLLEEMGFEPFDSAGALRPSSLP